MKLEPEHRLSFEVVSDRGELPDIINPIYIPKVGHSITVRGKWDGEKFLDDHIEEFEVTDIKYEMSLLTEEQTVVVYLK